MMGPQHTRGIGRYIEELLRAMIAVAPEHRYVLLTRDPAASPFSGHASVEHVHADVPWYGVAEQIRMPALLVSAKPDVVHVLHWNVPIFSGLPRVVTIHDLILLAEPASAKITTRGPVVAAMKHAGYRVALSAALRRSRRILVPTQWVAADIKRRFPSLATPVDVTGEGMPDPDPSDWIPADADHPYLLYVGGAYPHKNLDVLLDAWKKIAKQHPLLELILAGERDVFMQRLEAHVRDKGLPRVRFTGTVSDQELSRLYAGATAFVFPSRAEGFGLPPLEALAHGCPVVAARATSLPEVLGEDGVIFFQPGGTDDILQAIEAVLRDPVGVRERARQAAVFLRKRHDWRHAAERTLDAYERAVHGNAHRRVLGLERPRSNP